MSQCEHCADTGVKALYDSRDNRWAVRCRCGQQPTAAWTRPASATPRRPTPGSAIYPPRDAGQEDW